MHSEKLSWKEKFKTTKLGKELVSLREEMKPMTWKQRVDHIWTYYKEYIGLVALAIFVTTGLISSMFAAKDRLNTHLTGIMVNISINQEAVNYLSVDYAALLGVPAEKVKLESTDFSDLTTDLSEENYNASMIIVNEVSAKILDYMILDKLGMEFYTGQEVYMDLRDFFSLEELQAFLEKDQLIFCLEEAAADKSAEELKALQKECLTEAGKEIEYCWPAAVKITDMEFVKKNITNEGDIYFALAGSSQKMQQLRDFWEYIKAYK